MDPATTGSRGCSYLRRTKLAPSLTRSLGCKTTGSFSERPENTFATLSLRLSMRISRVRASTSPSCLAGRTSSWRNCSASRGWTIRAWRPRRVARSPRPLRPDHLRVLHGIYHFCRHHASELTLPVGAPPLVRRLFGRSLLKKWAWGPGRSLGLRIGGKGDSPRMV